MPLPHSTSNVSVCATAAPIQNIIASHISHTGSKRKPFSWEAGRDGGGTPRSSTVTVPVEDAVGATRQTGVAMRSMAAFSNGGDHLLLNKQWRGAVATSDEALIALNAKMRAELTAQKTKQVFVRSHSDALRLHLYAWRRFFLRFRPYPFTVSL